MKSVTFSVNDLTFILHGSEFDLSDSYTIAEPKITQSGNWEVWSLEAEASENAKKIEDVEFLPENRILEVVTETELNLNAMHALIAAFLIGVEYGEKDTRLRYQKMTKFAFESLTGQITDNSLEEAADNYFYNIERK